MERVVAHARQHSLESTYGDGDRGEPQVPPMPAPLAQDASLLLHVSPQVFGASGHLVSPEIAPRQKSMLLRCQSAPWQQSGASLCADRKHQCCGCGLSSCLMFGERCATSTKTLQISLDTCRVIASMSSLARSSLPRAHHHLEPRRLRTSYWSSQRWTWRMYN